MSESHKSSTKYIMVESSLSSDENEIDLLEIIRALLRSWKVIVSISIASTGLAFNYAFNEPEVFKAEALLAPAQEENAGSSSALSHFSGLAAIAGISVSGDSNLEKVIATLNSRQFLRSYISQNKLIPILFGDLWDADNKEWMVPNVDDEPTEQDAIKYFKQNILSINEDTKTGLITLSISWIDPNVAARWANDLVKQLNEQLREQAISDSQKRVGYLEKELSKTTLKDMRAVLYNLLEAEKQKAMLANVNQDFALEVMDPAVAPETHEKPKRKLIVAVGGISGIFLGVLTVCLVQFIRKLRCKPLNKS